MRSCLVESLLRSSLYEFCLTAYFEAAEVDPVALNCTEVMTLGKVIDHYSLSAVVGRRNLLYKGVASILFIAVVCCAGVVMATRLRGARRRSGMAGNGRPLAIGLLAKIDGHMANELADNQDPKGITQHI